MFSIPTLSVPVNIALFYRLLPVLCFFALPPAYSEPVEPAPETNNELCEKKLISLGLNDSHTLPQCRQNDSFAAFTLTPSFDSCTVKMKAFAESNLTLISLCSGTRPFAIKSLYGSAIKWANDPIVLSCYDTLAKNGINDIPFALCGAIKGDYKVIQASTELFTSCLKRGTSVAHPAYYQLEKELLISEAKAEFNDFAVFRYGNKSAYYTIVKDCLKDPAPAQHNTQNLTPTIIGEYLVHTNTTVSLPTSKGIKKAPFGGISGCNYLAKDNKLYCVSDDKENHRVYVFDVFTGDQKIAISYQDQIPLFNQSSAIKSAKIYSDFEDIFVTPDHQMILSGELNSSQGPKIESDANALFAFDADGTFKKRISVLEEFNPTFKVETEKYIERTWVYPPYGFSPKMGYWNEVEHTRQVATQLSGTIPNKGIEALTSNTSFSSIYYANEQGLKQDNSIRDIRIVKKSLATEQTIQYSYRLENEADNGVSAMVSLEDQTLLTLERGYNATTGEVTIRIFKTTLIEPSTNTLGELGKTTKKEVFDLADHLKSLAPGTKRIDNFEAMTIGPEVDPESVSLILATDNNFNLNQWTMFLMIKIPKALLVE